MRGLIPVLLSLTCIALPAAGQQPTPAPPPPLDSSRGRGLRGGAVPMEQAVYKDAVVDERPEVVSGPRLAYPDLLRQAGIEGRVIVQAIVDTMGRAEPWSVKIVQSPNPGFDAAAQEYVLALLFRPGRVRGHAVRVLVNIPIDFKIERKPVKL